MRLVPETFPLPRLLAIPLLALVAFAYFWLRRYPDFVLGLVHCPMKEAFGVPCPTCGGTHAAAALAAGDLAAAWGANPLVVVIGIGFGIWAAGALLATAVPVLRFAPELTPGERRAARILAALLIVLAWAWQIVAAIG